jgi:hypothetical protein
MLLATAGCGGSDSESLTADAYRDRANAICKGLNDANEKAFKDIDTDDQSAVIRATEDIGRRTAKALEDLDELEGPAESEAAIDRILATGKALGEVNTRRTTALASGDKDVVDQTQAEVSRLTEQAATAARGAGLDDCA